MKSLLFCHLFLAAAVAVAQPPPIPPAADHARPAAVRTGDSLTVADGKFCDVTVDVPAGASVVWRFYPPPVQRADKLPPGRAIFAGERGKSYIVTAVVIDFGKKTVTDTEFTVLFGGKADPKPDPKPDDPPPPPAGAFYFLVVRPDGPASPAFTKAMGLPEWAALRAAGHLVKDKSAAEAALLGVVVPAAQLPAVVTLRVAADGKSSAVARPAVPLPTTGAGVLDLPKGVN